MTRNNAICLAMMILAGWLRVSTTHADEVVLNSGEQFSSSKVWEENGKILFELQGLTVSVAKEDVASILRSTGDASRPAEPVQEPPPPLSQQKAAAPPVPQPPPKKAVPPLSPGPTSGRNQDPPGVKVRGIGLAGLAWQMKSAEIPGIQKLKTDPAHGGIDQYWWPNGNLTLGNVLLDGLTFGFWRNRLYSILLWVDGKPEYQRLRQAVFDRYGPGRKNEKGLERYVWAEDETTDRLLEFDAKLNTGIFWMRCRDLDQQIKQLFPE
jgi:hypothetical protein